MAWDPRALPDAARPFLCERHLATLTTLRADGSPHVTPVAFTWDDEQHVVRIITTAGNRKAANAGRPGARAVVCQVDGWRWLALEGRSRIVTDPGAVADAERRYAERYRRPRVNPRRVVLLIHVDRVLGLLVRPTVNPRPG